VLAEEHPVYIRTTLLNAETNFVPVTNSFSEKRNLRFHVH
jgi:hypothetical protein